MTDERELARAMATIAKAAIAPILVDVKALQSSLGSWELRWNDLGALRERIAVLETRAPIPGPPGLNGKDGAPGMGLGLVGLTGKAGADGLPGRDGADGLNGKDGADGLHGKDGAIGLNGKDGRDGVDGKDGAVGLNGKDGAVGLSGKDGANGQDGKDGRDGIDGKDGAVGLSGKDGSNGKDGAAGLNGKDGSNGLDGRDGEGLADAVIDRDGQLVLTFSDGRTKAFGVVVGKDGAAGLRGADGAAGRDGIDGKDGQDGSPGLSPEDFDWDFDPDTRAFTIKFLRNGIVIAERTKTLTGMRIYRGTHEQGKTYELGDVVTWNGCEWTAMSQTKDRPGNGATGWKLTVKHGEKGGIGPEGKPGRDGRDLTQMDSKGKKW